MTDSSLDEKQKAAVDAAQVALQSRGYWKTVALSLRDDNVVAQRLYTDLGFQAIGDVVRRRKARASNRADALFVEGLRPARWFDGTALYSLARSLTPHDILWADALSHGPYRTGPLDGLGARLRGRRRQ